MNTPINFPSTTDKFELPLLFSGQAQREFFINEALTLIDAIMQMAVLAAQTAPPTTPSEGHAYRVLPGATAEWIGQDNNIAIFAGGTWKYISPQNGLKVFDRTTDKHWFYRGGWISASEPTAPTGGTVIDVEARATIDELVEALRKIGAIA